MVFTIARGEKECVDVDVVQPGLLRPPENLKRTLVSLSSWIFAFGQIFFRNMLRAYSPKCDDDP
jgi:hypothetical protein